MTRTITITNEHLAKGKPRSLCDCPVALAIVAAGAAYTLVGAETAWGQWTRAWPEFDVRLPLHIKAFITRFDRGEIASLPEPLVFELEI